MESLSILGKINFKSLGNSAKKAVLELIHSELATSIAPALTPALIPTLIPTLFPINAIYSIMDPNFNPNVAWAASGTKWERLPDNYVLWTSSNPTAGNVGANKIAAGLPNITGQIGNAVSDQAVGRASGAFNAWASAAGFAGSDKYKWSSFDFNASRSNSIYGKSSTVQPPAIKYCAWRRVS